MAWKETWPMDERLKFVSEYLESEWSMSALCEAFGVSRRVGYKWIARYQAEGVAGLQERSRAPKSHPNATPSKMEQLLVQTRQKHPSWGPRKILAYLQRWHPTCQFPAPSTVGDILTRHELVIPRKRRWKANGHGYERSESSEPNGCWCTDYKGQFPMGDNRLCYPLTLQDRSSRYLLRCQGLERATDEQSRPVFESAFREYGLPEAMRSDNGSPFASASFTGLTKLSVWWLKLGIRLERIEPGHPEQNGRLERFHRTLKAETTKPPAANLRAQQLVFGRFRKEYNEVRPHQALGHATPASVYRSSSRPYPKRLPMPEYGRNVDVRRVGPCGRVLFRNIRISLGEPLAGQDVAFEPVDEALFHLRFCDRTLGTFDEETLLLRGPRGIRPCERLER